MHYISILSTIVTFLFTAAVLARYRQRGGMHLLLWGVGLLFYGLGTLTEAFLIFTYHPILLKVWYLTGAMLTAAWLGQGTFHLLVRRRGVAQTFTLLLTLVTLVAFGLVMLAPVVPGAVYDVSQPASGQYREILTRSGLTILLTILLNVYGSVFLIGGAIYSAYLFWRKKVLANRLLGNILIAAGALMPAMGGSFIKAGLPDWLYLSEFLGALLMYAGFVAATGEQKVEAPAQVFQAKG